MNPGPASDRVTLVVLAGGEGRRMGGSDKGLLLHGGRPLVAHVLERCAPQAAAVVISANRHRETYAAYGHPVVPDGRPGYCGPLAGIEAALGQVTTPWALIVPCDVPALPTDLCRRLAAVAAGGTVAVAVAGGRRHAVLLLPTDRRPVVADLLDAGERRLRVLFEVLGARDVAFDDCPEAFANLNSPDLLQR